MHGYTHDTDGKCTIWSLWKGPNGSAICKNLRKINLKCLHTKSKSAVEFQLHLTYFLIKQFQF